MWDIRYGKKSQIVHVLVEKKEKREKAEARVGKNRYKIYNSTDAG